ncbi:MAG: NAD-dependent epimerase/dehydratase family protein [Elusimicrobia bacterium]|nr:NAD-dependent epimerase/dehydratase family protein [Elusimicrobiota bacterium]
MKVLITGACGFLGGVLAAELPRRGGGLRVLGLDNLVRPGSESNRSVLRRRGVELRHGDLRLASDLEGLPAVDWVIDAAANPSVLAGRDGRSSSRQVVEHNLLGTVNVLEYCKRTGAGFILPSTSRVYSAAALRALPLVQSGRAFRLDSARGLPPGVSPRGVCQGFSTEPPLSLYGSSKLAAELLALEYGSAYSFPVWIDRCGVLAGAGQFGTAEQGIFSYWVHAWAGCRGLRYIGFNGRGLQVRDALHPADLAELVWLQMRRGGRGARRVYDVGGGAANAMSLAELSAWCAGEFGPRPVGRQLRGRPYDVPWLVMDGAAAAADFGWKPRRGLPAILREIAAHARRHPHWLELTGAR